MLALRSTPRAVATASLLGRRTITSSTPRRNAPAAPTDKHAHEHDHEHEHQHHHHHAPPAEESFGKGFYISIAAVITGIAVYKFDTSAAGEEGTVVTRLIDKYRSSNELWEARNSLHLKMVEQAAADRALFQDSKVRQTVNLKYPEVFNMGSPYNQTIGWSTGDLGAIKAHLEAQRK